MYRIPTSLRADTCFAREEMITSPRREGSDGRSPPTSKPDESETPLGTRFGVLGRKWSLFILRAIESEGRASFSQLLHAHHSLSRRLLSIRLKELQRGGYLERIVSTNDGRHTSYVLTDKGKAALPLLHAFSDLVRRYGEGVSIAPGREVRTEDLCFAHPDIQLKNSAAPNEPVYWGGSSASAPPRVIIYKDHCEKCHKELVHDAEAFVCSYECTWCRSCADGFHWQCPNCQGHLQPRGRLTAHTRLPRTHAFTT